MPDFLSDKDWGAEIKALKITKDGGLKDALAEWAKVMKKKEPDAQFEALEAVIKAAAAAQNLLKAQKDLAKFAATTETKAKAELARVEKEAEAADEKDAVDKELYAALKRAKTAPMYAAVVAKGSTDGKLLMSKAKVKPSEIGDAKKAVGGGPVLRAATVFENGVYVFELNKEPPATLAQLIKKLAKEQAGLMIRVLCRKGTKLQDLGEEPGEDVEEGASSKSKESTGSLADEYRKKLDLLTPLAKKEIAAKQVDTAVVGRLLQAAQAAAAAGDFAKGLQELQTLEAALKGSLSGETAQGEEASAENEQAAFDTRLKAVGADLLIHLRANPDDKADLTDLVREARDAGGESDFEAGNKLLDRIDQIIIAGKRAARGAEMAEQIPEGAASSGALDADRIQLVVDTWRVARETAVSGAATLAEMLRGSEYDDLHPIADFVDELVDGFPGGLDTTLEDLRSATIQRDTPQVKQFQSRSRTEIKTCLDYLGTNANLIAACEQHPLGGAKVAIAGPLKQSLKSILELVK